jgi:hypothetical protein
MNKQHSLLTQKRVFYFWLPLAATWLMMSVEGPFLAAIIARLANPKYNLAAYGVAFSFALIIEAPVIMIMSAATALVKDYSSFTKMRNFTYFINGVITLLMLIILVPKIFNFITITAIGLPPEVARLTHFACIILIPWPGAIGYRRFYQGILIRSNLTRRVAYGTIIRLISMSSTAILLFSLSSLDGALVGASALSIAVILEAVSSKLMAYKSVKHVLSLINEKKQPISYPYITKFYYPLALTSILGLGVFPMVSFFMGQSKMPIESLAVFPVIHSLVFVFRSFGLSYLEVGIALLGPKNKNYIVLRNFAIKLGITVVGSLAAISLTPLSTIWFNIISGLSKELTQFSILPTQIMTILPGLTVLLSFQRSLLISNNKTAPITIATAIEVLTIITILFMNIKFFDFIGIIAATCAFVLGRLLANLYLFFPYYSILKR